MTRVFFDVGLSLDGYLAGANRRPGNPLGLHLLAEPTGASHSAQATHLHFRMRAKPQQH